MGNVHKLVLELGREGALSVAETKDQRRAITMAADILAEEQTKMGFTFSGFCLTALPYKDPGVPVWKRDGHKIRLLVESGRNRAGELIGVPYGSRARACMIYLQTQAIKDNTCTVNVGASLYEFMKRVGVSIGGSQYRELRRQLERIASCHLTFFEEHESGGEGRQNERIIRRSFFSRQSPDNPQRSLWEDTVELDADFVRRLTEHPVPLVEPALRQIIDKPVAIDIYIWLAYRLHALQQPTTISWISLYAQFGSSFKALRQFKPFFLRNLMFALAVYPEGKVDVGSDGIILRPSMPPVPSANRVKRIY